MLLNNQGIVIAISLMYWPLVGIAPTLQCFLAAYCEVFCRVNTLNSLAFIYPFPALAGLSRSEFFQSTVHRGMPTDRYPRSSDRNSVGIIEL